MRLMAATTLCLITMTAVGCGGEDDSRSAGSPGEGGDDQSGALGSVVPDCPFSATEVSDFVGQSMVDQNNCLFGDGQGVASVNITTASEGAGATTLNYSREQAGRTYESVSDVDGAGQGYIAVGDGQAEAVVISDAGSYTIILSGFESLDATSYETVLGSMASQLLDDAP